jgi:hypothetical protein
MKKRIHPDLFRTPIYTNYFQLENYANNPNVKSLIYFQDTEIKKTIQHILTKFKYKVLDLHIIRDMFQLNINIFFFNPLINHTSDFSYTFSLNFMKKLNFYKFFFLRSYVLNSFLFFILNKNKKEDQDQDQYKYKKENKDEVKGIFKIFSNKKKKDINLNKFKFKLSYNSISNLCNLDINTLITVNEYLQFDLLLNLIKTMNNNFQSDTTVNLFDNFLDKSNKMFNKDMELAREKIKYDAYMLYLKNFRKKISKALKKILVKKNFYLMLWVYNHYINKKCLKKN